MTNMTQHDGIKNQLMNCQFDDEQKARIDQIITATF